MINVSYSSNWFRDRHHSIFKNHKILSQHYNVLRIVKGQHPKPASPGYILDVMVDKGRDLTRLVDKLVKLDYLERNTCSDNRRKVDITITSKGIEIVEQVGFEIDKWIKNNNNLTESEADHLSELLDKLRG